MVLMHDGLILGLTPQDFIFKLVIFVVVFLVAFLVERFAIKLSKKALDSSKLPSASIFVNILRGVIWAFAILAVLQPVFGIQPTAFVTALGVTSIALSFGLQDTISNLAGGLGLMLGGVVKPGDQVSIGTISGEVIDMNWRSTIVRARGGRVDIIPNSVSSIAETGIKVIIHVHIKDDANEMSVRDKIVRALAGSSWLAGVGA